MTSHGISTRIGMIVIGHIGGQRMDSVHESTGPAGMFHVMQYNVGAAHCFAGIDAVAY